MNVAVPANYAERLDRLAVGFEPVDAVRGGRYPHPLRFEIEPAALDLDATAAYRRSWREGQARPVVDRHDSCRYALLYQPRLEPGTVNLRIDDPTRRAVPRRFRLPIPSLAAAAAAPPGNRVRRPLVFPGAAFELSGRVTGLRARVIRNGAPLRWARIEARLPGSNRLVGRAHGDDRGEFLLVLEPSAAPLAELTDPLSVRVIAHGPAVAPVPPAGVLDDHLWDLPLELLPAPGAPDPISSGETLPAGYVATGTSTRLVDFRLGRLVSAPDFVFT